jgi:tetratricopeptide (TPR) repeat protein
MKIIDSRIFRIKQLFFYLLVLYPFFLLAGSTDIINYSPKYADEIENKILYANLPEKLLLYRELIEIYLFTDPQKAIETANKSLAAALSAKDIVEEALAKRNIGRCQAVLGSYADAMLNYQHALTVFKQYENQAETAITLNNMGILLCNQGLYEDALENVFEALKINEAISKTYEIGITLNNIALINASMKRIDNALHYFKNSLKLFEQINNQRGMAMVLNNIGTIYDNQGNSQEALKYYSKALEIRLNLADNYEISTSYGNIAYAYKNSGKFDLAIDYFDKALKIVEKARIKLWMASIYSDLGDLYAKKNNRSQAEYYLQHALDISIQINAKQITLQTYQYFYQYHQSRQNYQHAFLYLQKFHQLNESIFNVKSNQKIAEIQTRYETEKKEKQIALLQKENNIRKLKSRYHFLLLLGVIVIFILVFFFIFRYYRHELYNRNQLIHRTQIETKLKVLQSRINPHFLYNTLNALIGFAYENNADEIEHLVKNLSTMYRNLLELSDSKLITIQAELNIINSYLEIEKSRLKDHLEYSISVDKTLLNCKIPPLIIEPAVENAVEHGICKNEKGGRLELTIEKAEQFIRISVKDNGLGFDQSEFTMGFGLYSIQERLKLFYKNKAVFALHSVPGQGTELMMEVPYDYSGNGNNH